MKFRNIAELHNKTSEILKEVNNEGYIIITSHGKPTAIIKKFSEDDIEDFIITDKNNRLRKRSLTTEKKIISILKNHGVTKIRIFGSYARGENSPKSDIDIIVKFSEMKSLLELVRIERELEESTGLKIHLLTEKSINPHLTNIINKEAKVIYEQ